MVSRPLDWFKGAAPALEANPALLGVGYIIGTRISCIMVAGGMLACVRARARDPFLRRRADQAALSRPRPPSAAWTPRPSARSTCVYIGAGAVAAGGIISLCRALPLIVASIALRPARYARCAVARQSAALAAPIATCRWGPSSSARCCWSLAIWVFLGFDPQAGGSGRCRVDLQLGQSGRRRADRPLRFPVRDGFVAADGRDRLVVSNPISGMTVATLLLTCLIFLHVGMDLAPYRLLALSVAAVVCIASSNGGTTSQDLKTGFLVGATPKWQQWAILVGSVSSALVIGAMLLAMNHVEHGLLEPRICRSPSSRSTWTPRRPPAQEHAPKDSEYVTTSGTPRRATPKACRRAKYLVDDQGQIRYLVDPGISGKLDRQRRRHRSAGSTIRPRPNCSP